MITVIKEVTKKDLLNKLYDLDITDKFLYDEINSGNYLGIFQFNGTLAEEVVNKVHPDNFDELVVCNALSRPGTSSFTEQYVFNKHNKTHSTYHPLISSIIEESYRVPVYQEQTMSIFNKIGNFSFEKTNLVRGLMKRLSKAGKKPEDLKAWNDCVNEFVEGAVEKGIPKNDANKIADDLLQMSSYLFNKSHAVAYTYNALMTLYLSYYFRNCFYSAVLTYEVDRKDYLLDRMLAVKSHGINILPPDVNKSKFHFAPNGEDIVFGLNDIKFVGEEPAKSIIANAPYSSFIDFIIKNKDSKVNKRVVIALASSGAFDSIEPNRKKFLYVVENFYERKKSIKVEEKLVNLISLIEKEAEAIGIETTENDLIMLEKEYFDFNFFHSLFSKKITEKLNKLKSKAMIETNFKNVTTSSVKVSVILKKIRDFKDKNGNEMAFIEIEDMFNNTVSVPIFSSYWKEIKSLFIQDKLYLMNFYRDKEEKILFGKSSWVNSVEEKKRMVLLIE